MCKKEIFFNLYGFFFILISLILISTGSYAGALSVLVEESYREEKLQHIEEEADSQADTIASYYERGKALYYRGDFKKAISNFEKVLESIPGYKPAKLYLECAVARNELNLLSDKIKSIKLKMSDIIAEYDKRTEEVQGLAFGYLLKQALLYCQAGDFTNAEHYYNLCYKLAPRNKETITWFVEATYELKDLSESLDKCYEDIKEEISGVESLD